MHREYSEMIHRPIEHKIGNYKPLGKSEHGEINKVYGPDFWIMFVAVIFVIIPTLIIMIIIIPSYDHIVAIICLEILAISVVIADMYSFYVLVTCNPGIIPRSLKRPSEQVDYYIRLRDQENLSDEYSQDIKLKICDTCLIVRPPRSFHCAKCDVCIEVHDHHCPWVGGCIGMRNHKKFVTFLFMTSLAGFIGSIVCLPPIIQRYETAFAGGNDSMDANFGISICIGIFTLSMGVTLFFFGLSHLYMASK